MEEIWPGIDTDYFLPFKARSRTKVRDSGQVHTDWGTGGTVEVQPTPEWSTLC